MGLDSLDLSQIEIGARQVEVEGASRGLEGGASGDGRIVMKEMHVIESDLPLGEVKVGIKLPNGFAVSGGIGEVELSITAGIENRAGRLHGKIGSAEDGIVVSGESLKGS